MSEFNVFISYSSADRLPTEICHNLEKQGLKCWIAPRNITPGTPYARAIMQGLINSDTVLIFISSNSLKSEDVLNEVDNAHGLKKNIVPIFIENVALTPEFSYYLKRKQWITAYDNLEGSINTIIDLFGGKAALTRSIPDCKTNNNLQNPPFAVEYIFDRLNNREEKSKDDEFIFPIDDVFTITGHGIVVTGTIESGSIYVGDEVWIAKNKNAKKTIVSGIEMFRKLIDSAEIGDNPGLLLKGITKNDVKRGMVLVSKNPHRTHDTITIAAYIFTKDEGNPTRINLKTGDRLKIYNRCNDVEATIIGMSQTSANNGDYLAINLRLDNSIFIMKEDIVAMRIKSQTVGAGLVYGL